MDIRNFFKKPATKDPASSPSTATASSKPTPSVTGKNTDVVRLDEDEKKHISRPGVASIKKTGKRRIESSSESEAEVISSSSSSDSDTFSDEEEEKPRKRATKAQTTPTKPPAKKARATPPAAKAAPPVAPAASSQVSKAAAVKADIKATPASFFGVSSATGASTTTIPAASTAASSASSFFTNTPAASTSKPTVASAATFASPFAPKASTEPATATDAAATTTTDTTTKASTASKKPHWLVAKDRGPPPNKGKKLIPTASHDLLSWGGGGAAYKAKHGTDRKNTSPLTFVISGVLDSLERSECEDLVKRHGGKVTGAVSGKTDYLVLGEEGGAKKKADAIAKGAVVIDEDGLIEIICKRAGLPFPYTGIPAPSSVSSSSLSSSSSSSSSVGIVSDVVAADAALASASDAAASPASPSVASPPARGSLYKRKTPTQSAAAPATGAVTGPGVSSKSSDGQLLVDKYRPVKPSDIVGNNSNVDAILQYLSNFAKRLRTGEFEQKNGPKRALLICGPPGTGKTSAAAACAKQLGMDVLEFNASDARAKSAVEQEIGNALRNRSLRSFQSADGPARSTVVIMDECDGMSSSDRGGMAELIKCIKTTQTPVICICNDAQATQIRSLKNHTEVLTWRRVPAAQLAKYLCKVAAQEGVNVDSAAMEKVIEGARGDIRQALNVVEMWKRGGEHVIRYDTALAAVSQQGKDLELGVFDVVPELFRPPAPGWLNDRLDSYFTDADIVPLFVHENYLQASPAGDIDALQAVALAADDISFSDRVSTMIQRDQNYTLMPVHGYLSCILPASLFKKAGGMLRFPGFLGKLSTTNKRRNFLSMLKTGLWNHGAATSKDLAMNTLWAYRMKWGHALAHGAGVERVAEEMEKSDVGKEEWDAVVEFGEGYGRYGMESADTKTKSALTRSLNKAGAGRGGMKVSKGRGGGAGGGLSVLADEANEEVPEEEEEEEEKEEEIKPVAAKKAPAKARAPAKKKG